MVKPLADIGPDEGLASGVQPSLELDSGFLWEDGQNAIFRERAIRPEPGQILLFNKIDSSTVIGMGEVEREAKPILYWGTTTKIFRGDRLAATPVADVSGATYQGMLNETGDQWATRWSMEPWGEYILAANGIDELQIDTNDGSGMRNISALPGYTAPLSHQAAGVAFKPHFLVTVRGHMLALNHHVHSPTSPYDNEIPEGEQYVWWCSNENIALWGAAADNSAGGFPVKDAPVPFSAAVEFLDGAIAFTRTTAHLIVYLGPPNYFDVPRALFDIGAWGPHSVSVAGRAVYGLGPQGFWVTDGTQVRYIDTPGIRDFIFGQIDESQASKIVSQIDPKQERVIWYIPTQAGNLAGEYTSLTVAFDYKQGIWHPPGYVRTAAAPMRAFDYPIVADATGNIYRQSVGALGAPPPDAPLVLPARYACVGDGYGRDGYGGGGYGGEWNGEG